MGAWNSRCFLPSALPELANGIRTALALTFVLLVSSELIVARAGLGYLIGFLGEGGVYDAMFAVVLVGIARLLPDILRPNWRFVGGFSEWELTASFICLALALWVYRIVVKNIRELAAETELV